MEIATQILVGVICFAIFSVSIVWQGVIYEKMGKYGNPSALLVVGIPGIIGGVIITGSISWSILVLIDSDTYATLSEQAEFVGTIIILAAIFFFKNLFGAVLSGATLSWAIYMWYQHGQIELIPIFQMVISTFMSWAPMSVQKLYIWITLVYALISSIISSGSS